MQIRRVSYPLDELSEGPASTGVSSASSVPGDDADTSGCTPSHDGYDYLSNDQEPLGSSAGTYNHSESHTERKEKAARAWTELRPKLVPAVISASGFPPDVMCRILQIHKCNYLVSGLWFIYVKSVLRDINLFH